MYRRSILILAYLTRLLASTAIIPTALVAGMLSFPTTCECGADHPHDHSIFGIADHHHGDKRENSDREVIRAGADGATVQAPTGGFTAALAAVQAPTTLLQSLPRPVPTADAALMPDGHLSSPEVPPPQA